MNLTNYKDTSRVGSHIDAGFRFEFHCGRCSRTWTSPFEPYRRGQLAGVLYRLSYYLGDRGRTFRALNAVSDAGMNKARNAALGEALELAAQRYFECAECAKTVCEECWDSRAQVCLDCSGQAPQEGNPVSRKRVHSGADGADAAVASRGSASAVGATCPNCTAAMGGGRFCPECGFDMASTHKSCPGCGTMCLRSARFCPDCGHGF